ncbi:hypothetical protein RJ639_034167 [Escallonia herrerae]|uniref:Uncharacterized protein n=1 Tax=Escallonia herrerae TaxID=1293975 RepID=A0AA88X730_9ASTE|nr:hypothetical protein RJ639_034167 [Escallonia herrerae]
MPPDLVGKAIGPLELYDTVDLTLSLQNPDGGFASFETTRSYPWLEVLNRAETFGDIIIYYSYTECTSAEIQSLKLFTELHRSYRPNEIQASIESGVKFIESTQLPDGSWFAISFRISISTLFKPNGIDKTFPKYDAIRFLPSSSLALPSTTMPNLHVWLLVEHAGTTTFHKKAVNA